MSQENPIILPELLQCVSRKDALNWLPFREGVEICPVYGNNETGASAALLRYQPGAEVPEHTHTGYEHVLILSGSQIDRNGIHAAGTLVINPPGSSHQISSPDGCVALLVWEKPVRFEPG